MEIRHIYMGTDSRSKFTPHEDQPLTNERLRPSRDQPFPKKFGLADRGFRAPELDAPFAPTSLPIRAVQKAGVLHRADIRRALAEYGAADAVVRLEIARQYPDVQLTPSYSFEEGFARYVLNAGLQPLFGARRSKALIVQAEAEREHVAAQFEALQAAAIGEMDRALEQYKAAYLAWQTAGARLVEIQTQRETAARRTLEAGEAEMLWRAEHLHRMESGHGTAVRHEEAGRSGGGHPHAGGRSASPNRTGSSGAYRSRNCPGFARVYAAAGCRLRPPRRGPIADLRSPLACRWDVAGFQGGFLAFRRRSSRRRTGLGSDRTANCACRAYLHYDSIGQRTC